MAGSMGMSKMRGGSSARFPPRTSSHGEDEEVTETKIAESEKKLEDKITEDRRRMRREEF